MKLPLRERGQVRKELLSSSGGVQPPVRAASTRVGGTRAAGCSRSKASGRGRKHSKLGCDDQHKLIRHRSTVEVSLLKQEWEAGRFPLWLPPAGMSLSLWMLRGSSTFSSYRGLK
ncbi:hypothetical protein CHARACLAT_023364, partial [Characodon lateralis]|nr:hypothetical protein [Characodon lateralis]